MQRSDSHMGWYVESGGSPSGSRKGFMDKTRVISLSDFDLQRKKENMRIANKCELVHTLSLSAYSFYSSYVLNRLDTVTSPLFSTVVATCPVSRFNCPYIEGQVSGNSPEVGDVLRGSTRVLQQEVSNAIQVSFYVQSDAEQLPVKPATLIPVYK